MTSGSGSPASAQRSRERARDSARATGPRYASIAVVEARSYSRNSGATSCEATTCAPGWRRRSSSATARSCVGSRNEKSRQTATASASSVGQRLEVERREHAVRARCARRRRSSARAARAAPDGRRTAGRGGPASGGAGGGGARSRRSRRTPSARPCRSSSAFVATVVPCVKRSTVVRADRRGRRDHRLLLPRRVGTFAVRDRAVLDEDGVRERAADVDAENRHARECTRSPDALKKEMAARRRRSSSRRGRRAGRLPPDDRVARCRRRCRRTGSTRRRGRSR